MGRIERDTNVCLFAEYGLGDLVRAGDADLDRHTGMCALECGETGWQNSTGRSFDGGDDNAAAPELVQVIDRAAQTFQIPSGAFYKMAHELPLLRGHDAASAAY